MSSPHAAAAARSAARLVHDRPVVAGTSPARVCDWKQTINAYVDSSRAARAAIEVRGAGQRVAALADTGAEAVLILIYNGLFRVLFQPKSDSCIRPYVGYAYIRQRA